MRIHQVFFLLISATAAAQQPDTASGPAGAVISGVVHDSVSQSDLAGAIVQLIDFDGSTHFTRTTVSDSHGRFTLRGIPEGRFKIGFFHSMLDSLGLDAPVREVSVTSRAPVRLDLAIPSAARVRAAVCGAPSMYDSSAIVVGFIRDAHKRLPLSATTVTAEWVEISLGSNGIQRRVPRVSATTGPTGWFAICNVPSAGTVGLSAKYGADSTDLIELEVPPNGFLRQDLYLDASSRVAADNTAKPSAVADSHLSSTRPVGGSLSGTVVAAVDSKPIAGAEVTIASGPKTRTNEKGDWTLVGTRFGTRILEVRAVGYYPGRTPVSIVEGSAPIRIALSTFQAVLDTIRVNARALSFDQNGFLERRRSSGGGHFLTPADIAQRQPLVTSDLFQTVPGLTVERGTGQTSIKMRGIFEDKCVPAIYIDGAYMPDFSADDVDDVVHPNDIAGIEVYMGAALPPQFQKALSGCGSIVIWTKRQVSR